MSQRCSIIEMKIKKVELRKCSESQFKELEKNSANENRNFINKYNEMKKQNTSIQEVFIIRNLFVELACIYFTKEAAILFFTLSTERMCPKF